jgi:hypothetical protein
MQLLISWSRTDYLWLQGSLNWDGWESCNDLVECCWEGTATARETVVRLLHTVQISPSYCIRRGRSLSAFFPHMDNLEGRHKLWVELLLTELLGRWLWRVKHASVSKQRHFYPSEAFHCCFLLLWKNRINNDFGETETTIERTIKTRIKAIYWCGRKKDIFARFF